jgi:hypothetical protein
MSTYQDNKALVTAFYNALELADVEDVESVLKRYTSDDYAFFGVHPFNELQGTSVAAEVFWKPFLRSWKHVQRRQDVFMAGTSEIDGDDWVMSMGHLLGLRDESWLGIPATRRMAFLRYADFNCVENGKITKTGFFCDIISVMNQSGLHPLPAQTGASFIYPGPRTHDGLLMTPQDAAESEKTLKVLNHMINDLDMLNLSGETECPPEYLAQTWCDDMVWYGPAGIGASYTIERYQEQHQRPFRKGLKDKIYNGHVCRFAEGNYACFFGWPNLTHTPTGGFLGLPGNEKKVDMRVVDVYRREGEKLAENWVLIDLPYWLLQQGLDILERNRELKGPDAQF